jgi:hypothetical protein
MIMRLVICLVLVLALCGTASTAPAVESASGCENVRGTVEAQITGTSSSCPGGTIVGDVFDESGNQIGTTTACIISADDKGNTLHADLTHTYTIGNLNFSTVDQGVLSLIAPNLFRFENRLTIVDGASGFLRAHGTVDVSTGEINLAFNGQICVE